MPIKVTKVATIIGCESGTARSCNDRLYDDLVCLYMKIYNDLLHGRSIHPNGSEIALPPSSKHVLYRISSIDNEQIQGTQRV